MVTSGGELGADAVLMAVPLPVAARLTAAELPDWSAQLAAVPYLGVVCALVRSEEAATPYFWVNVNDPRIPFNGFIEYSNLNRSRKSWKGGALYVPMYLATDDPRFSWSDNEWTVFFREGLGEVSQ